MVERTLQFYTKKNKLIWIYVIVFFRIIRAFLIEEQKIVVRVLKAQEASKKKK